jgi:hypothetical protein
LNKTISGDVLEPDITKDTNFATSVTFLKDTHRTPACAYVRHFGIVHAAAPKQVAMDWIFWFAYNSLKLRLSGCKSEYAVVDGNPQLRDIDEWKSVIEVIDPRPDSILNKIFSKSYPSLDAITLSEHLLEKVIVRMFLGLFSTLQVPQGYHVIGDLSPSATALLDLLTQKFPTTSTPEHLVRSENVRVPLEALKTIHACKNMPPQEVLQNLSLRNSIEYVIEPINVDVSVGVSGGGTVKAAKPPPVMQSRADEIRSWVVTALTAEAALSNPFTQLIMSFKPYVVQHIANQEMSDAPNEILNQRVDRSGAMPIASDAGAIVCHEIVSG